MPLGDQLELTKPTIDAISNADVIGYETIERLIEILDFNNITSNAELISIYDHTNTNQILSKLRLGMNVVLVVDEGQAGLADPGCEIANACLLDDIAVDAIPGPSSITTAAALSGYNLDNFFVINTSTIDEDRVFELIRENPTISFILLEMQNESNNLKNFPIDLYYKHITVISSIDMPSQKMWRGQIKDIGNQNIISKTGRVIAVVRGMDG